MSETSKKAFRVIFDKARAKSGDSSVFYDGLESNNEIGRVIKEHKTSDSRAMPVAEEHDLQRQYRPLFGKEGLNQSVIGCHPSFLYLQGTDKTEYHHICSLFIDIKNSTRLSFLYPLEVVASIKNAILKAASEIIRCLDGYVHRFMGDAVLAYFGNRNDSIEDSIVNAINCAALLESLMVGTILPVLEDEGIKGSDLGFRIGLDYGPKEEVLWASYGYSEVNEVTATSFYVDVASKLQSMAKKNQAMLGHSIISKIDLHDDFLKIKTRIENGAVVDVGYLDKAYTNRSGGSFKYPVREMNHAVYRDLLPFASSEKQSFPGSRSVGNPYIIFRCYVIENNVRQEYRSVSRVLPKFKSILFKLTAYKGLATTQLLPLKAIFTKKNYGQEASAKKGSGEFSKGEHQIALMQEVSDSAFNVADVFEFDESTEYRGLHTMECEVRDAVNNVIYRQVIGVFIE